MTLLSVIGLSKNACGNILLKDVTFMQQRFQKIAIAGETGAGKSTLLKLIAGLIQPDAGEVIFDGERILGPEEKLIPGHKQLAYLSQHFELRNNYRVEELLAMANKIEDEDFESICNICQVTHLLQRRTDQLSGGEKQRIATARLLITSPKMLLLDEPYSNLDNIHKQILKSVIHDISEKLKITVAMVSHDPLDTLSWADEIIIMQHGQIIQTGTPFQVYNNPVNEYAAGLFGSYNILNRQQLEAFTTLTEDTNVSQIYARPEHFKVAPNEHHAVIVEIIKSRFFGSYYETDVMFCDKHVTMKTVDATGGNGDLLYVSLDLNKLGLG